MVQTAIVAVLVAASAVFAAWRLMPARTRLRLLDKVVKPNTGHATGWLARLRRKAAEELAHGCGACSKASSHIQKHAAPRR